MHLTVQTHDWHARAAPREPRWAYVRQLPIVRSPCRVPLLSVRRAIIEHVQFYCQAPTRAFWFAKLGCENASRERLLPSFRDGQRPSPESIATNLSEGTAEKCFATSANMDSGLATSSRPGMTRPRPTSDAG